MVSLKRGVEGEELILRVPKQPRVRVKAEQVLAFLTEYFKDENGRLEKLPNPRYGRDEWRLPPWLTKVELFKYYSADCVSAGRKCFQDAVGK